MCFSLRVSIFVLHFSKILYVFFLKGFPGSGCILSEVLTHERFGKFCFGFRALSSFFLGFFFFFPSCGFNMFYGESKTKSLRSRR